jgi:hypothetical protein
MIARLAVFRVVFFFSGMGAESSSMPRPGSQVNTLVGFVIVSFDFVLDKPQLNGIVVTYCMVSTR